MNVSSIMENETEVTITGELLKVKELPLSTTPSAKDDKSRHIDPPDTNPPPTNEEVNLGDGPTMASEKESINTSESKNDRPDGKAQSGAELRQRNGNKCDDVANITGESNSKENIVEDCKLVNAENTSGKDQGQSDDMTSDADDHDFLEAAMKIEETIDKNKGDDGGGGDCLCVPEDTPRVTFDPATGLRLQRLLLEVVEEVRMRRVRDAENEERIRQLVKENHEMENKYEEARSRLASTEQTIADKVAQAKRERKSNIQELTEAKVKLQVMCDANDKEAKALKYEVKTLQLCKYTLERKIRELERKFASTSNDTDTYVSQLTDLETRCEAITARASQVQAAIEKLDKNVEASVRVNRKFTYVNQHQTCEIKQCKNKIENLTQQLNEAKVDLANVPLQANHQINQLNAQIAELNHKLSKAQENTKLVEKQLQCSREDYKEVTLRLTEAHHLVSRHVESGNKTSAELQDNMQRLESLLAEHERLETDHNLLKATYDKEQKEQTEKYEELSHKSSGLELSCSSLTKDLEELRLSKSELEYQNTSLEKKNLELNDHNKTLEEELNRPKSDKEVQACVLMVDVDVDVRSSYEDCESQTVISSLYATQNSTQTELVTWANNQTQTTGVTYNEAWIQVDSEELLPVREVIDGKTGEVTEDDDIGKQETTLDVPDVPSSAPVSSGNKTVITSPILPSSQPPPGSQASSSVQECLSPRSRFQAKLKTVLSTATATPFNKNSAVDPTKSNEMSNSSCENSTEESLEHHGNDPERKMGRSISLKKRNSQSVENAEVVDGGDSLQNEAVKVETYPFQFLRIPELQMHTKKIENHNNKEDKKTPAPHAPLAQKSVCADGPRMLRSLRKREPPARSTKSSEPVLTGILTDPGVSRPKRSKKVHFSDRIFAQDPLSSSLTIDEYESDTLFSEDEEEGPSLRPSQVTRLENFIIQEPSQS